MLTATACGDGARPPGRVTIEPIVSQSSATTFPTGGKPAAPPAATGEAADTATPAVVTPEGTESADHVTEPASPTPRPLASDGSSAPASGRWIDVDVTTFSVVLMDGDAHIRDIAPSAVGAEIDTGAYASTQTGLFHVYNKAPDLAYDPPYDAYISDWVGFDPDKANGFHSFLKDKQGNVVDARTGRISNGCIRTGAADAVFAYAEIGMPVWVHY